MKQRGITSIEVEFILQHPDYIIKKPSEQKMIAIGHLKGRVIKVIYAIKENYINIITIR